MRQPRRSPAAPRREALSAGARWAMVVAGVVAACAGLRAASLVFAPLALAVVFGLMFAPAARRIERLKAPPALSALIIVILTGALMTAFVSAFAWPVSVWFDRLPDIWNELQTDLLSWKPDGPDPARLRENMRSAAPEPSMSVTVDGGKAVESAVLLAPAVVSQMIVFLAGVYFFVATRERLRAGILGLCVSAGQRRRADRVIATIEAEVSRYMLAVSGINLAMGAAVGLALWAIGAPQPWMWGVLAAIMNFMPYVGTAVMVALLVGVGMIHFEGWQVLLPALAHSAVNLAENQFITPHVLGRTMTLNPFAVFFAILFGLWLWGPIGGIVAVPMLLLGNAVIQSGRPRPAVRASAVRERQ